MLFNFTVLTTGLPNPSLTETGALPSGITFTDNGNGTATITGRAPAGTEGTYPITISAANGNLPNASQTFTLTVVKPPEQYDLVGSDGGVFVFGQTGGFYGSLPGLGIHVGNIVGIVPTADERGYFLVGSDGGVFAFGDAPFENSLPGLHVNVNDIVGIVPTTDDRGYFLVGSDGGVFAFGDAGFENSLPGLGIHITTSWASPSTAAAATGWSAPTALCTPSMRPTWADWVEVAPLRSSGSRLTRRGPVTGWSGRTARSTPTAQQNSTGHFRA